MRLASLFCSLIALAGISVAQDTNFPVGPQYLITSDSPMFLHPIATPTLSLSTPTVGTSSDTPVASPGVPPSPDLTRVYWGAPETNRRTSDIEITSAGPSSALPPSILDVGVTGITNAQSLRERGYGIPLGDAASYWKTHKPRAARVYTNADVQRLHQS